MTLSVAAPLRTTTATAIRPRSVRLRNVYLGGLAFWLVTRWLVLVHQGAWPWMNEFVVAAARGIVVGDWNEAVRPQLPAVLGVPLVLAGATEQQMVAALYVLASLVQFIAVVVLLRAVFPGRLEEQTLGLLVFLLVPFNHSIHHYRDMPVVLASAAIFLVSADFVRAQRRPVAPSISDLELAQSDLELDERSTSPAPHRTHADADRQHPEADRAHVGADPAREHRDHADAANADPARSNAESDRAVGQPGSEHTVRADGLARPDFAPGASAAASSQPVEPSAAAASAAAYRSSSASPPPARPSFPAKRNDQRKQNGIGGVTPGVTPGPVPRHKSPESVTPDGKTRHKVAEGRHFVVLAALMLLGIWSRIEMLTFVAILIVASLIVLRKAALGTAMRYAIAAAAVTISLLVVYRIENVDLSQAWFYTAHTFLDSTPDSWLTPACQANPTENCREADGLGYFGPADLHAGVLALAMNHPLTTFAKSARSAWDNAWVLVGPNPSTFPGVLPFVIVVAAAVPLARELYRGVPKAVWVVVVAIAAASVLPPLTWAPPHPQYHVALVLPMVLLVVPALVALMRMPRGRLVALAFLVANAGLSAFRYTRYPGY